MVNMCSIARRAPPFQVGMGGGSGLGRRRAKPPVLFFEVAKGRRAGARRAGACLFCVWVRGGGRKGRRVDGRFVCGESRSVFDRVVALEYM